MTYYEDSVAKVYYDPMLDTLFLEYLSRVPNDNHFIKINTALLDAFLKLNTQKFVADIRRMGMISVNSQKWVTEILLPGMLKHLNSKMLYHAQFLDGKDIMVKVSGNNIKHKSKDTFKGFEVVQFSDRAELEKYLMDKARS